MLCLFDDDSKWREKKNESPSVNPIDFESKKNWKRMICLNEENIKEVIFPISSSVLFSLTKSKMHQMKKRNPHNFHSINIVIKLEKKVGVGFLYNHIKIVRF